MAYREDATMKGNERAVAEAPVDGVVREPEGPKLGSGYDAVLAGREVVDPFDTAVKPIFTANSADKIGFALHATTVAGKCARVAR